MKELKIGEEIRIRCVEGQPKDEENRPSCVGCVLWRLGCHNNKNCDSFYRTDHKNVHFEIVEENQCPSDETIMRVLNCIGYEERSWIDTVKKNWGKVTKEN